MHDYVYYLKDDGEFIAELIFSKEAEAIEYAEKHGMKKYEVIEWDVG